jgi:hypothetical protein
MRDVYLRGIGQPKIAQNKFICGGYKGRLAAA